MQTTKFGVRVSWKILMLKFQQEKVERNVSVRENKYCLNRVKATWSKFLQCQDTLSN